MKPGKTGFTRVAHAFGYSLQGINAAWKHEASFRQEIWMAAVLLPLAVWLATSHIELILLVASVFWVIIAELINSSVEAVVDRTGSEVHELSGRAKDIGSAVVLFSLILLALVWGIIACHRFF
ncbi:diacylglycerol kinase [Gilvimarinus agarilyticus]|uniref:diacylglycerol kinase n=1 Tax=unclassified Gilvimarinus TaxID=2642066 RepID=UPI001C09E0B6|nr:MULTISPECIES: diacylglycerol kinase [unclassified Gilvimarinus]MBU2884695.1 diacylglycerol kinase [Gilvimarinus agarilyticus]MDO6569803.1 diacylglycerol kinase [Gilvimarinus sp. 2_MG-2023]MDO6747383.1 diacylglycerol kinase [Gilvimarinus sp. 1_MG-2023]